MARSSSCDTDFYPITPVKQHSYDVGLKGVTLKRSNKADVEARLKAHLAARPSAYDIQARTIWAQKKDLLEVELALAK